MGAKDIQSMDDVVHSINKLVETVNKFISDHDYDKKLAEILLVSTEADDLFLANTIMKMISDVELMAVTLKYLDKPIRIQGKLRTAGDNAFFIDQTLIKEGEQLEILIENRWHLVTVMKNPQKANAMMLRDTNQKAVDVSALNGAAARMR